MADKTEGPKRPGFDIRLVLGSDPKSVGEARRFVRDAFHAHAHTHAHDCGDVEDMAVLLVSELVTNVVRHTGGSRCELSVRLAEGKLHVEVVDSSAEIPRPGSPGPDDQGGRGLVLVDAVAERWGAHPGPDPGKTIWFELPAADG